VLDIGEGCDENTSGECDDTCNCNPGFVLGDNGVCQDIDECAIYTCAFLDDEGEDAIVSCEHPAENTRLCTCLDGDVIGEPEGTTQLELVGLTHFPGCTNADELTINDVIDRLVERPVILDTLLSLLVPATSVTVTEVEDPVDVGEDDEVRQLIVGFSVPDGHDVSSVPSAVSNGGLASAIANLFALDVNDITVVVTPRAKRVDDYTATVTFLDAPAGHVVVSLVALASVLFYQLF
jgi:hypothetical protein